MAESIFGDGIVLPLPHRGYSLEIGSTLEYGVLLPEELSSDLLAATGAIIDLMQRGHLLVEEVKEPEGGGSSIYRITRQQGRDELYGGEEKLLALWFPPNSSDHRPQQTIFSEGTVTAERPAYAKGIDTINADLRQNMVRFYLGLGKGREPTVVKVAKKLKIPFITTVVLSIVTSFVTGGTGGASETVGSAWELLEQLHDTGEAIGRTKLGELAVERVCKLWEEMDEHLARGDRMGATRALTRIIRSPEARASYETGLGFAKIRKDPTFARRWAHLLAYTYTTTPAWFSPNNEEPYDPNAFGESLVRFMNMLDSRAQ